MITRNEIREYLSKNRPEKPSDWVYVTLARIEHDIKWKINSDSDANNITWDGVCEYTAINTKTGHVTLTDDEVKIIEGELFKYGYTLKLNPDNYVLRKKYLIEF